MREGSGDNRCARAAGRQSVGIFFGFYPGLRCATPRAFTWRAFSAWSVEGNQGLRPGRAAPSAVPGKRRDARFARAAGRQNVAGGG
jgi:hypothetical protein